MDIARNDYVAQLIAKNWRQTINYIADNWISDSKSISKAIGLKPSITCHQAPQS